MTLCKLMVYAMLMAHGAHQQGLSQTETEKYLLTKNVDPITADLVTTIEWSHTPQDIELTTESLYLGCSAPNFHNRREDKFYGNQYPSERR